MGSTGSKASSNQATVVLKVDKNKKETYGLDDVLLDPRSPDIVNRTPLSRLHNSEESFTTPHKTIMNSSGEKKLLDPRSPSQFIPRTPLNMSLDGEKMENSIAQYSLEYSGCIEEASCRNFNERLENITFDDSYVERISQKKTFEFITSDDHNENQHPSPNDELLIPTITPEETKCIKKIDVTVYTNCENISPVVDGNTKSNKRSSNVNAFSSTPFTNQQKPLSVKKFIKENKDIHVYSTPTKRMVKSKEPRTPFGCLQNQQQLFGPKDIVRSNNIIDVNLTPLIKRTNN